jgi:hypothetical protein
MNYNEGYTHIDKETGSKIYPPTAFFQIAEYLSERGFVVLQYNKRGIDSSYKILDSNVWGNATVHDLQQDAEKVLDVLIQQRPEVNVVPSAVNFAIPLLFGIICVPPPIPITDSPLLVMCKNLIVTCTTRKLIFDTKDFF